MATSRICAQPNARYSKILFLHSELFWDEWAQTANGDKTQRAQCTLHAAQDKITENQVNGHVECKRNEATTVIPFGDYIEMHIAHA